jgi:hypothetical protein
MTMLIPQGEASFSGCGRYRYRLSRELGGTKTIAFIMLNPSTADGTKDDPTIRRCKGFARDWGYGRLLIVNLYAFRATEPRDMWRMCEGGGDLTKRPEFILGEDNDSAIVRATCEARGSGGIVICAWGKGGTTNKSLLAVHAARQARVARLVGGDLYCLGENGDGSPKHPLYLPEYTEASVWRGPR